MQRSALLTKVALQDLEDEERGDRTRLLRHVRSSTRMVPAPLKLHSGSSPSVCPNYSLYVFQSSVETGSSLVTCVCSITPPSGS